MKHAMMTVLGYILVASLKTFVWLGGSMPDAEEADFPKVRKLPFGIYLSSFHKPGTPVLSGIHHLFDPESGSAVIFMNTLEPDGFGVCYGRSDAVVPWDIGIDPL